MWKYILDKYANVIPINNDKEINLAIELLKNQKIKSTKILSLENIPEKPEDFNKEDWTGERLYSENIATPKQLGYILSLAKKLGYNNGKNACEPIIGRIAFFDKITKNQAGLVISKLKKQLDERKNNQSMG